MAEVDNYDDEEVRGLIGDNAKAIEDLEKYVGTIPEVPGEDGNNKYADLDVIGYINKKAQETLAAASGNSSETAASVKGQLDDYIGQNNTRVKAVEDDVAAIKDAETGILKQAKDYADGLAGNYDEAGAAAGVKSELTTEINKKVDKVEGKDLIATSEIERLATLANYDDTQVKADIAKKADAEAMTTELGKKVDKVEGYSLVSDTEIERLAGVNNYDDTAVKADIDKKADSETMTTELGKKVDKVEGYSLISDEELEAFRNTSNFVDAELYGVWDVINENSTTIGELGAYVGTIPTDDKYKDLSVVAYIDKKAEEGLAAVQGVQSEVDAVEGRMDTAEGKITALETESAKHAIKTEVEEALALKADKTQVATDIASAIAPLATTEALNGVKATAEAATTVEEVDAQIDAKITALKLGDTYEPIGAETRAKAYADGLISDANLGQYTTEDEVKSIVDSVIKTATDKETLDSLVELVEYIDTHSGDAINMATAIGVLEGKVEVIEEKPAYGISAAQITNWDNEVGAKALAVTKLDASTFTEYSNAHAGDYTNAQIDTAISTATGNLGTMSTKSADDYYTSEEVHGALSDFATNNLENDFGFVRFDTISDSLDKADSAVQENTVVTFTSVNAGVVQADKTSTKELYLSAGKLHLDGETQTITVDKGLVDDEGQPLFRKFTFPAQSGVLATASEVSTAKQEAIAAAKTETESQVTALNDGQVTTNKNDIASLFEMLQWGSF